MNINLSLVLRSWRHHEELSLAEAAERVGLTLDTYRRVERGAAMEARTLITILHWLLS